MRQQVLLNLEEAVAAGARWKAACELLNIPIRTVERWKKDKQRSDQRTQRKYLPKNKLTEDEEAEILALLNSKKWCDKGPEQIVPALADEGRYLASESTMYRILRRHKLLAHRLRSKPAKKSSPRTWTAKGPNQVWTWDITYLPTEVRGLYFYLYLIVDIYSRKIVGYSVHTEQTAENAEIMVRKAHLLESPDPGLVLHSDNGSPMKGATLLGTLQNLNIISSYSRPAVSNDNAFSEAIFRTLKYRPAYPERPFST